VPCQSMHGACTTKTPGAGAATPLQQRSVQLSTMMYPRSTQQGHRPWQQPTIRPPCAPPSLKSSPVHTHTKKSRPGPGALPVLQDAAERMNVWVAGQYLDPLFTGDWTPARLEALPADVLPRFTPQQSAALKQAKVGAITGRLRRDQAEMV
jgi:hypothetical protein